MITELERHILFLLSTWQEVTANQIFTLAPTSKHTFSSDNGTFHWYLDRNFACMTIFSYFRFGHFLGNLSSQDLLGITVNILVTTQYEIVT
jgi:hypothetical protein